MKALSILKSAIDQSSVIAVATLISLISVIYPEIGLAEGLQTQGDTQTALVFEIKDPKSTLIQSTTTPEKVKVENQNSISFQAVVQNDPLVAHLQDYLEAHGSPLAPISDKLVTYPHWQRAIGISLVESSMCVHTPKTRTKYGVVESHNCSGIGGEHYKQYVSYEAWFADMTDLLGKPNYVNRPLEKFLHYYVQPGSMNWLHGVQKTEAQLAQIVDQSNQEKIAMQSSSNPTVNTASINVTLAKILNK